MAACGVEYAVQDEASWEEVLATDPPERVRLLGGDRLAFARASGGSTDVALYAEPVLEAGRIELLTFLREQSIAVTAHRLGSPTHLVDGSAQLFGAQGGAPHHPHHSGGAVASLSQENLVLGRSRDDPSTSRSTLSL